jgi:hypothetical protein
MTDAHTHDYSKIELERIVQVQDNYAGSAGDKALLLRTCDCGKRVAFEYGEYKAMKELHAELSAVAPIT